VYEGLFKISQQDKRMHEVFRGGRINLTLSQQEEREWVEMVHEIEEIQLNNQPDIAVWDLERGGNFTTSSLYQRVITEGVQDVRAMECWNAKLPLKVFLWILNKNRIQSTDQLLKKK
jgi:hypothetical protein